MTESDTSRILLVRAIEETDRSAFTAQTLEQALAASAGDMQPSSWFLKRACYLLNAVPQTYTSVLRLAHLPQGWNTFLCVFSFCAGLGTNYLGPAEKIPLLANPIMALVAWNLLVYAILGVFRLSRAAKNARRTSEPQRARAEDLRRARPGSPSSSRMEDADLPWMMRILLPSLWISLHQSTLRFHAASKQVASFARAARRFWIHWAKTAEPLLIARWRRLVHCCAVLLAAGAILGIYIRGVFLKYEVIWTSTFVTEENTVARLVDVIFAPAGFISRLAGRDLRAGIHIDLLMSPAGDPAASWIHLFALTALLLIVVPRSALAVLQWLRLARAGKNLRIDFDDYFASLIRPQIGTLLDREIELAIDRCSESMATFVCSRLYDGAIVLEMAQFRENGGKISELRERMHKRCDEFTDEISGHAAIVIQDLEGSLATGLERIMRAVQQDFKIAPALQQNLRRELQVLPRHGFDRSMPPLAAEFTDALSVAISASLAVALGTVAGGFGESLEVAIIVALFGTTGPVGFLIGATAGLMMAAGAWWLGREKLAQQVENISLPGALVRLALWQSRFNSLVEEGRMKCHAVASARVNDLLAPLSPQIAAEVWTRLESLWQANSKTAPRAS
jgi:hypothetical protein